MTRRTNKTKTAAPAETAEDTSVSMALFVPVAAPRVTSTSHAALVKWRKLRREYEEQVAMRCNNDSDRQAELLVSVRHSFDETLLGIWCDYIWDIPIETLTDELLLAKIDEIISSVKNDSVPDVAALFKEAVRLDIEESDVKERVVQFFAKSRELIDEHGWQEFFTGKEGVRLKCKLLVESLEPRSLREEVTTVLMYQQRAAKDDEKALFKLIVAKALEQDRDFHRRKRARAPGGEPRKQNDDHKGSGRQHIAAKYRKVHHDDNRSKKNGDRPSKYGPQGSEKGGSSKPPVGGCLKCKGDHWVIHCPTASAEEKKELLRQRHERRDSNRGQQRPGHSI